MTERPSLIVSSFLEQQFRGLQHHPYFKSAFDTVSVSTIPAMLPSFCLPEALATGRFIRRLASGDLLLFSMGFLPRIFSLRRSRERLNRTSQKHLP